MSFSIQTETPPLREESDGSIRIGNTRVLLELVIHAFQNGATPESIIQSYPSLELSETYSAIAYYLNHRSTVDTYIKDRELEADRIETEFRKANSDQVEIRDRLEKRFKEIHEQG